MVRGKSRQEPQPYLIGYARVSTQDQSLDLQLDALRAAGVLEDNLHVDKASGAKRNRPGLNLALKDGREGDTFVVWKLDRLTRSVADLYEIMAYLDGKGVGFRSLTESIDTTTPGGRLILGVLAVIAQFERELTAQRTAAGIKAMLARDKRKKWGRKALLTPAKIAQAGRMLNRGMSGPQVAKHFGVSTPTVYQHWKYAGEGKFIRKKPKK